MNPLNPLNPATFGTPPADHTETVLRAVLFAEYSGMEAEDALEGLSTLECVRLRERVRSLPASAAAQLGLEMRTLAREPLPPNNAFRFEPATLMLALWLMDFGGPPGRGPNPWEQWGATIRAIAAVDQAGAATFGIHLVETFQRFATLVGEDVWSRPVNSAGAETSDPSGIASSQQAAPPLPAAVPEAPFLHETTIAEVSRRRNAVEPALRSFLGRALWLHYGTGAPERAQRYWTKERVASLSVFDYWERWDALYFDELTAVVRGEWDRLRQQFQPYEKETVLHWLEHINRYRVDAHAKRISEEDFAYIRVAFKRLEEALRRYMT